MSWSAAEISALAGKAARGAGAPPGQAARFGQVAAVHLMAGRPPGSLRAALDRLPVGPLLDLPVALDAALASGQNTPEITADAPADLLQSYVEVLPCHAVALQQAERFWRLECDKTRPQTRPATRRITGADDLIARMTYLAEKTLVPESGASRGAGAGAGLTDND